MTCGILCLKHENCDSFAFDLTSKCVIINNTMSLVRTSSKNPDAVRVGIIDEREGSLLK